MKLFIAFDYKIFKDYNKGKDGVITSDFIEGFLTYEDALAHGYTDIFEVPFEVN
jgi:hypothetical protein